MLTAILLITQFAFVPESWSEWDKLCAGTPFVEGTLAPVDPLMALHHLGVLGEPGEPIPTAKQANESCQNYAAYRAWEGAS